MKLTPRKAARGAQYLLDLVGPTSRQRSDAAQRLRDALDAAIPVPGGIPKRDDHRSRRHSLLKKRALVVARLIAEARS